MTKSSNGTTSERPNIIRETIHCTKQFTRALHSKKGLVDGLSSARLSVVPAAVPEIVSELFDIPIYRRLISREPFPKTYTALKKGRPLLSSADAVEALWTASILRSHAQELNKLLAARHEYDAQVLAGKFNSGLDLLNSFEAKFGHSLWQLGSRIALLQIKAGTSAQKEFLQSAILTSDVNPTVAYLSYLISIACEDNVSLAELLREWGKLERAGMPKHALEYMRYQINPFDLSQVPDPWKCCSMEENSSALDRLDTFLEMAQLAAIRATSIDDVRYLKQACEIVADIDDRRIENLRLLLSNSNVLEIVGVPRALPEDALLYQVTPQIAADLEKRALEAPTKIGHLESVARARLAAHSEETEQTSEVPIVVTLHAFEQIIGLSDKYEESRIVLQKLALLFRRLPLSRMIAAFLDKTEDRLIGSTATENEAIWAMSSDFWHPSELPIVKMLTDATVQIDANAPSHSVSVWASKIAIFPGTNSGREIESTSLLPKYAELFQAHAEFNSRQFGRAFKHYQTFQARCSGWEAVRAHIFLYRCAKRLGQFKSGIQVFTDCYIRREPIHLAFPMEDLAAWVIETEDIDSAAIDRTIALRAYTANVSNKYESDLSDAFEEVLDFYEVAKPSELFAQLNGMQSADIDKLKFFWSEVCTIRTMEDCARFLAYNDVEEERITILENLLRHFPEMSGQYGGELSSLTLDRQIARLTEQFDRSRIYVNEPGIKKFVRSELTDAVIRYQRLLAQPDVEFDMVIIERHLKRLLTGERDNRKSAAPASERVGLFMGIVDLVLDAFVLSPEHGFKTYLSTRILHGSLEGELRSSFMKYNLLFAVSSESEFDEAWQSKLRVGASDFRSIRNAVFRFSRRVSDAIVNLKNSRARVKSTATPNGLFDFEGEPEELKALQTEIEPLTKATDVADEIIKYLWTKVDRSLIAVRREIDISFRREIAAALAVLRQALTARVGKAGVDEMLDNVVRAETEFQTSIERVTSWFQRAGALPIGPFVFSVAVEVAAKMANSGHPTRPIKVCWESDCNSNVRGTAFEPMIDILQNCFRNAIEHAGFCDRAPQVFVSAMFDDDDVHVQMRNELSSSVDLAKLREMIAVRTQAIARGETLEVGRGRGFRDITQAVSQGGAKNATPTFSVSDEFTFNVEFSMKHSER